MTSELGLLLDVDGPIADPETRRVGIRSIVDDLVALANGGTPVVFNTGRSDAFVREQVIAPMRAAGLRADAPVHAVCEKGATWFSLADGEDDVHVDESLLVPTGFGEAVHALLEPEGFTATMFWDDTKRTMVSVEKLIEADQDAFLEARRRLEEREAEELDRRGLGDRYRVEPNIIAVDVEHRDVGKALGAERALELVREHGEAPRRWITAGDSRSDYDMADWLHEQGFEVEHLDVRPSEGVPEKPYRVRHEHGLENDAATADLLAELRR